MKTTLLSIIIVISFNSISQDFGWLTTVGSSLPDVVQDVTTDAAGNSYSTGKFYETLDFDNGPGSLYLTSSGNDDIFYMKQDPNGNVLWAHSLGQPYSETASSIAVDSDGNVYIAGSFQVTVDFDAGPGVFELTSIGDYDNFLLKVNSAGDFVWAKRFGSTNSDYIKSIEIDNDNNVVLVGWFLGTCDFDPGPGDVSVTSVGSTDIFVLKLNDLGGYMDVARIGGPESESFMNIAIDNLNNVYLTGTFSSTVDFDPSNATSYLTAQGIEDLFLLQLDTDLNYVWVKTVGGASASVRAQSIALKNNKLYVTGSFSGSVDFDPGNNVQMVTSDAGSVDIFVLQMDVLGNYVACERIGGPDTEFGSSIQIDDASNVYIVGGLTGTTDFDAGVGSTILTSNGGVDGFLLKLDNANQLVWAHQFGGTSNYDAVNSISVTASYDIIIGGYFSNSVDFDPGVASNSVTSQGEYDLFILKLTQPGVGINELQNESSLFPNPATNQVNVVSSESIEEIMIFDMTGKPVQTEKTASFSIATLTSGVYFVHVISVNGTATERLVKE